MKCNRCGKENPAEIHTCTPKALVLADQLEDAESARLHLLPYAAAELRRLQAESLEDDALREKMSDILRRTAITLKGDAGDFDTLAVVVNTCLIRAEQIAPELVARVIDAQDALMRIKARHLRTGRFGLDAQAMAELLPIIDLHEQLIDLSAPVQMKAALLEVMARIERGQFFTTKEQA